MKTITINSSKSKAIYYWASKEEGSFEDHNASPDHVFAILKRFGKGKVTLTEDEAKTVLKSGDYQSTAWLEDEIEGGLKTMDTIKRHCDKIRASLIS
jgi:hypothetical protein